MTSTVSIAPRTSVDSYGKPQFGTAVSYSAHISRKPRLVRTVTGQDIVSEQSIYLNGSPAIQPTAQVTLSTSDVGSTESVLLHPLIRAVDRRFSEDGAHHTVLALA